MTNYNYYDPQREAYRQAERRVKAKMGFYWHLASYLLVNGFLITIYLLTSWADNGLYYPWFIWPLFGWGIGLLFNFLAVFVFPDTPVSRQKMIEKEMGAMGIDYYSTFAPTQSYSYQTPLTPTQSVKPVPQSDPSDKTPVS